MVQYFCDPLKKHQTKISTPVNKSSDQSYSKYQGYFEKDALLCKNCIPLLNKEPKLLIGESSCTGKSEDIEELSEIESSTEIENDQDFSASQLDGTNLYMLFDTLDVTPMEARKYTAPLFSLRCL